MFIFERHFRPINPLGQWAPRDTDYGQPRLDFPKPSLWANSASTAVLGFARKHSEPHKTHDPEREFDEGLRTEELRHQGNVLKKGRVTKIFTFNPSLSVSWSIRPSLPIEIILLDKYKAYVYLDRYNL